MAARTVEQYIRSGVAGAHLEDQVSRGVLVNSMSRRYYGLHHNELSYTLLQ